MRARRKASGLKSVVTWEPLNLPRDPPPLEVRLLHARNLALHVMTACKIEARPELLKIAHRTLARWRERDSGAPGSVIRAWRKALRLPWPELSNLLTDQSKQAVRLRCMTPFFGVLTPRERKKVNDAFSVGTRFVR